MFRAPPDKSKNTPLIISAPGFEKNMKMHGIEELLDIYPTLSELAGIPLPEHLEGMSMVPLLQNPEKEGKEAAFTKWRNGISVTTNNFSYTEWDNNQRMLFDLKKDPNENENIAEINAYASIVIKMKELIEQSKTR